MRKRFLLPGSVALLFCSVSMANATPAPLAPVVKAPANLSAATVTQVSVTADEAVRVSLSRTNVNRLYVKGDPITAIHAPAGILGATHDRSGSVYITLRSPTAFTAFVTTEGGRHFSLLCEPVTGAGRTIEFRTNQPTTQAITFEQASDYPALLIRLIKTVRRGEVPSGYGETVFTDAKPEPLTPQLGRQPIARYTGAKLAVMTYRLENRTSSPLLLSPARFYAPGVRAVALVNQQLPPHGVTELITVVTHPGGQRDE